MDSPTNETIKQLNSFFVTQTSRGPYWYFALGHGPQPHALVYRLLDIRATPH